MESIVAVSGLILGKEVVVQSISSTSTSILKSIKSITDNYDNETKKLFEKLDIKFKLDIISSFIEIIHNENIINSNNSNINNSNSNITTVEHCINYIKDIMDCIENEVKLLEEEITLYKSKWLGNLSYRQFRDQFEKIRTHVSVLDNRFDTLVKIIK
tara:strand:- start:621 stop:1091 length:471 start_codon:yes stop_codon:yes gene_type:complete